jgi:hypothetical protein
VDKHNCLSGVLAHRTMSFLFLFYLPELEHFAKLFDTTSSR